MLEHLASLNKDECILIKYQPDCRNVTSASDEYALMICLIAAISFSSSILHQPEPDNNETDSIYPLLISNEEIPVIVTSVTLDNPISFANSVGTLVISDDLYHTIAGQSVNQECQHNGCHCGRIK